MSEPSASTFGSDFKRFFLRGLVILLPTVLTLWIVVKAYQFVDSAIAEPINQGLRVAMVNIAPYWTPLRDEFDPTPEQMEAARQTPETRVMNDVALVATLRTKNIYDWWATRWYMDLIGLVVAIVAVYIAGRLLGGFLGKRLYRHIERLITSVPVFKQVYPYVKQIVDFLFSDEKTLQFSRVVAVEYPRKGVWSVGFQTGPAIETIHEQLGDSVTVFIPCSPTPFTGYAITVPRGEVLDLPISVEEAIRFIVSAGVLVPQQHLAGLGESSAQALMPPSEQDKKLVISDPTTMGAAGTASEASRLPASQQITQTPRLAPEA